MRHIITLTDDEGNIVESKTVTLQPWQSGSPYYQTGVSGYPKTFTEISGKGMYYVDLDVGVKCTILVDGAVLDGFIGLWFNGENEPAYDPR